jgi:hypothetical protein
MSESYYLLVGANIINYGHFHVNYRAQLSCEKNIYKLQDYPQIYTSYAIYFCSYMLITLGLGYGFT